MASKKLLTLNMGMNWAAIAIGVVVLFFLTSADLNRLDPAWHSAPICYPELHHAGLITRPSVSVCGLRRWSGELLSAVAGRGRA
jgi:hypothetical protein